MQDKFCREISYLRVSVTQLCNLRCRYCMPIEGINKRSREEMLTQEELIAAVRVAASIGIKKVRITGGEPLVKKNILAICEGINDIAGIDELSMTTNGILIPKYADDLYARGIRRVNISIDTLRPDRYRELTRLGELQDVLRGIDTALEKFDRVKLNIVLIGGFNDDEIPDFIEYARKNETDVRFIELMPMYEGHGFGKEAFISAESVTKYLTGCEETYEGVAHMFKLEGSRGRVGVISPISDHFCTKCSRLRLTADGKIKPCLHSADEYSIKGLNEEEMREMFIKAIEAKPKMHEDLSYKSISHAGRTMNRIGG